MDNQTQTRPGLEHGIGDDVLMQETLEVKDLSKTFKSKAGTSPLWTR